MTKYQILFYNKAADTWQDPVGDTYRTKKEAEEIIDIMAFRRRLGNKEPFTCKISNSCGRVRLSLKENNG